MFSLATLPSELGAELGRAENLCVEFGLDWLRNLAQHALGQEEEAVVACWDPASTIHPEIIGPGTDRIAPQGLTLVPLALNETTRRAHSLSNFYTSLYRPITSQCDGAGLEAIFNMLRCASWRELRLSPLSHDEPEFSEALHALRRAGWRAFPFFCFGNWYLPTDGLSFDAYLAKRPSQLRNTIKRRTRKFLAEGGGRLELLTSADGIDHAIEVWTQIYNTSWKVPEPFPSFMPGLIRLCAQRGWLRLGIAYYEDIPVAAQIWIVNAGRAAIYKLAYNETYAHHSAGTILSAFLMRHVLDVDHVREVDYLIGDEPYKRDWMTHRRERWGIVAYNPGTPFGMLGWGREVIGRWLKGLWRAVFPSANSGKAVDKY